MKNGWMAVVALALVSCGKPVVQAPSVETAAEPTVAHEVSHDEKTDVAALAAPVDPACPLFFPKAGLCAVAEWKTSPSADTAADLVVRFWKAGQGTRASGPYVAPPVEPKAFFIMKCCKTPKGCPLKSSDPGVYQASGITLISGEYWHYVQVGAEKASSDVVVP